MVSSRVSAGTRAPNSQTCMASAAELTFPSCADFVLISAPRALQSPACPSRIWQYANLFLIAHDYNMLKPEPLDFSPLPHALPPLCSQYWKTLLFFGTPEKAFQSSVSTLCLFCSNHHADRAHHESNPQTFS